MRPFLIAMASATRYVASTVTASRFCRMMSAPVPPPYRPGIQPTLPFDYAAVLPLRGEPGNIVQGVINISADSPFVAVGMSYGFEERRDHPTPGLQVANNVGLSIGAVPIAAIPAQALVEGIRFQTRQRNALVAPPDLAAPILQSQLDYTDEPLSGLFLRDNAFATRGSASALTFLFSAVDTSSGRELQDQPILSLASLGEPDGRRPFRHFSRPFYLAPRSTIRLQVIEQTPDVEGDLFLVIFGYKLVSASNCPPPGWTPASRLDMAGGRSMPFDYTIRFSLTGEPGNRQEQEVPVDAGAGFRVTSIGYALQTETNEVPIDPAARNAGGQVDLTALRVDHFPVGAWLDGFRIRPRFLRFVINNAGRLGGLVDADFADRIFERLNRPEDVSFRYAITDGGTSRDLQNIAIFNIAGLGSADGKRPFRPLLRPLELFPRSTLKVSIVETYGRGELFLVFQGYRLQNPVAGGPR